MFIHTGNLVLSPYVGGWEFIYGEVGCEQSVRDRCLSLRNRAEIAKRLIKDDV